jgi:hypothetical protein
MGFSPLAFDQEQSLFGTLLGNVLIAGLALVRRL